jgi:hypothetical protein
LSGINGLKELVFQNHKRKQCSSLPSTSRGSVRFEFIPQGQTVNQAYYVELLMRLRETVRGEIPYFNRTIEFSTITMLQLTKRCQAVLA